jgi:hypothetical protein
MSQNRTRQRLKRLDEERRRLLGEVLEGGKMVQGSRYEMHRRCGKPNCRCTRGEGHVSWYLSRAVKGRTKLIYIGGSVPARLSDRVRRYQRYQKTVAKIRRLDSEISAILNAFRDARTEPL